MRTRILLAALAGSLVMSSAVVAKEPPPKKKAPALESAPAPSRGKAMSPMDIQKAEEDVPEPPKKKAKPAEKKPEVKVKAGASLQTDYRSHSYPEGTIFTRDEHVANYEMRRARIEMRGEIGEYYNAKLSADVSDGLELKDAYINFKYFEPVQLYVGQSDTPFGTEALGSTMNYEFLEKSMMGKMTDNGSDRGMVFHGEVFDSIFSYNVGFLSGAGDSAQDNNSSSDFVLRTVLGTPKDFDSFFHGWVGFSLTSGTQSTGEEGSSIKVVTEAGGGGAKLFEAEFPAELEYDRSRFGFDATALFGPVTTKFEYFSASYDFGNPVSLSGGYVLASVFLTGEQRTVENGVFESQKIDEPFDPDLSGLGAWEVAMRYSWFDADANFFAANGLYNGWEAVPTSEYVDSGSAFTLGVNWYPEQKVRIMFNWVNTFATDPTDATSTSTVSVEQAFMFRFQIGF